MIPNNSNNNSSEFCYLNISTIYKNFWFPDRISIILSAVYYECHKWGLQKCKNNQKIPTGRDCTDFEIQLLHYCGLNSFLTDFTSWPLLRPNWVGAVNFGLEYIQQGLDNACLSSFGYLKGKQLVKSWFL